jgi:hypothetical protein
MKTKIIVTFDPPPIPIRQFDWRAQFEDYDGASPSNRLGFGADRNGAVIDLLIEMGLLQEGDTKQ